MKFATIYLGNDVEHLASVAVANMFFGKHVFHRRYVITPGDTYKNWLKIQITKEIKANVAMGMEFVSMNFLVRKFLATDKLSIKSWSKKIAETFREEFVDDEILRIVGVDDGAKFPLTLSIKQEITLQNLSRSLAKNFVDYAVFGRGKVFEANSSRSIWQKKLWQKIAFDDYKIIPSDDINVNDLKNAFVNTSIHIFGFSFLPKAFLELFAIAGKCVDIFLYTLSPCNTFWLENYRERDIIERQRYEANCDKNVDNDLLANLGNTMRTFATWIEDSIEVNVVEKYLEQTTPTTLLSTLQRNFLNLDCEQLTTCDIDDDSINIHECNAKFEEVTILKKQIIDVVNKKNCLWNDIIVAVVPNIDDYAKYISAVFGVDIPFDILPKSSSHYDCVVDFLNLGMCSWTFDEVVKVLSSTTFQNSQGLSQEDIDTFTKILSETNISWGFNLEHKKKLLNIDSDVVDDVKLGTWEEVFDTLLEQLYRHTESGVQKNCPLLKLPEISFTTEAAILGKCIAVIRKIFEEMRPIIDNEKTTSGDGFQYVKNLCKKYFCDVNALQNFENDIVKDISSTTLGSIAIRARNFLISNSSYSSLSVGKVVCQSLKAMTIPPHRAIFVLGLNDGDFPSKVSCNSMNLLNATSEKDFYPNENENHRTAFLECLISARSTIHFFFSADDRQNSISRSILLTELMQYLDKIAIVNGGIKPSQHCLHKHDISYDTKEVKQQKHPEDSKIAKRKPSQEISITDLQQGIRSPEKLFFKNQLEFSPISCVSQKVLKKFFSNKIVERSLAKTIDKNSLDNYSKSKFSSNFPFATIWKNNVESKLQQYKENLLAINVHDIFSIELNDSCKKIAIGKNVIVVPSLKIGDVRISGIIDNVCKEGLLCYKTKSPSAIMNILPTYMVLLNIFQDIDAVNSCDVIFVKDLSTFRIDDVANGATALQNYIKYFLEVSNNLQHLDIDTMLEIAKNNDNKKKSADISQNLQHLIKSFSIYFFSR